ncbi:glycosyltransferase [Nocardioides dubius]|uniref:glycosyltransferase n=1 Tax=Nocardioides dubius TaxID=317019 RepID=UPI0031E3C6D3
MAAVARGYRFSVPTDLTALHAADLTIASVPSGHVYVRHLERPDGHGTSRRLPDPDPDDPGRAAQQRWWPPVMLRPQWAQDAEFDVFHVHFGFDACSPADLERLTRVLAARDKRLVLTAHDLRNPHHEDRLLHDAQLDVLMAAADAVVTLTPGAAREIADRWGVAATVLPHPHVVDFATMRRLQQARRSDPRDEFRVGLHLKSLRASMAPLRLLPALAETVATIPGGVLQVNGHRDVLEPTGARRDPALARWLERQAARGRIDLRVHDFLPDDALWEYLAGLDVSVLPYRFGTHSGWLEACRDLGTQVIAPTCGYYAEQGPVLSYQHDEHGFDADSLIAAVHRAHALRRQDHAVPVEDRRRQRQQVAEAQDALYRSVR